MISEHEIRSTIRILLCGERQNKRLVSEPGSLPVNQAENPVIHHAAGEIRRRPRASSGGEPFHLFRVGFRKVETLSKVREIGLLHLAAAVDCGT